MSHAWPFTQLVTGGCFLLQGQDNKVDRHGPGGSFRSGGSQVFPGSCSGHTAAVAAAAGRDFDAASLSHGHGGLPPTAAEEFLGAHPSCQRDNTRIRPSAAAVADGAWGLLSGVEAYKQLPPPTRAAAADGGHGGRFYQHGLEPRGVYLGRDRPILSTAAAMGVVRGLCLGPPLPAAAAGASEATVAAAAKREPSGSRWIGVAGGRFPKPTETRVLRGKTRIEHGIVVNLQLRGTPSPVPSGSPCHKAPGEPDAPAKEVAAEVAQTAAGGTLAAAAGEGREGTSSPGRATPPPDVLAAQRLRHPRKPARALVPIAEPAVPTGRKGSKRRLGGGGSKQRGAAVAAEAAAAAASAPVPAVAAADSPPAAMPVVELSGSSSATVSAAKGLSDETCGAGGDSGVAAKQVSAEALAAAASEEGSASKAASAEAAAAQPESAARRTRRGCTTNAVAEPSAPRSSARLARKST